MTKSVLLSLITVCFLSTAHAEKVEIKTNMGSMTIELNRAKAPKSVENFLKYVRDKHYDGTIFHRVIPGFMIQGGGFEVKDGKMSQRKTRKPVFNEASNGLKNKKGTIAMARTNAPHSATSQFFINHKNNTFLDYKKTGNNVNWGYAVFGKLIKGDDVLDKIAATPTGYNGGMQDVPNSEVKILSVKVVK